MFSVIIPTFNRKAHLVHSIQSVLDQSFTQWELIIVDDGSTDGTSDWVKNEVLSQDSRIQLLQQNQFGVSIARNNGACRAQFPWIAFLDSDDLWLKDKLQLQYQYICENPQYHLIHTQEQWKRNHQMVPVPPKYRKLKGNIFFECLQKCAIGPSTAVIKKSLFFELGGFDSEFPACEDYDLWLRFCHKHEVGLVDQPLVVKCAGHPDQLSFTTPALDMYRLKSLIKLYKECTLTQQQREETLETIQKKSKIFLKGVKKHKSHDKYQTLIADLQNLPIAIEN